MNSETGIFLLAGGKGSRLKQSSNPELRLLPKPLVHIESANGKLAMIDNVLIGIFATGLQRAVLLTSSDPEAQAELIEKHTSTTHKEKVQFIREDKPLGTAGAVFNGLINTKYETVGVIPSDTLFPFEQLPKIIQNHHKKNFDITWVVTTSPGENAQNAGRILVSPNNKQIIYALEGEPNPNINIYADGLISSTSVGVVIVNKNFFVSNYEIYVDETKNTGSIDLYRHFIPWLLFKEITIGSYDIGQPAPDLGTPDRLERFGRNHSSNDIGLTKF